jgi:membrane fusion protein (multidrug efflux system)
VTVRAVIDNADRRLRPGMLMTVEMRRGERENPSVPGSAIVRFQDDTFVFVLVEGERGMRAVRRDVVLGLRSNGVIEVRDGLEPGEQIVAEGVHRVRDGATVRPVGAEGGGGGAPAGAVAAVRGA